MIFSTINQINCFITFLFFGIIFGIILNVFSIIFIKKYLKIYQKIIFESIFYTLFAILFIIFINFFNFGQLSLALVFAFVLGIIWINRLSKNLVDFLSTKWYTYLKVKFDLKKAKREETKSLKRAKKEARTKRKKLKYEKPRQS